MFPFFLAYFVVVWYVVGSVATSVVNHMPDAPLSSGRGFRSLLAQYMEASRKRQMEVCTSKDARASASTATLLAALEAADFQCTELLSHTLAPSAVTVVPLIVSQLIGAPTALARRNGWRTLGNFCWNRPSSTAEPVDASDPCWHVVVGTPVVTDALTLALTNEADDDVMNDVLWVYITWVGPGHDPATSPQFARLREVALDKDEQWSPATRFRSASGVGWLLNKWRLDHSPYTMDLANVAFLVSAIGHRDEFVARAASFGVEQVGADSFSAVRLAEVRAALDQRDAESKASGDLATRIFVLRALDKLDGRSIDHPDSRVAVARDEFTATYLGASAQRAPLPGDAAVGVTVIVRASAQVLRDGQQVGCYAAAAVLLQRAFLARGAPYDTPVPNDPTTTVTILVLPSPALYHTYMSAFVGFGANSGGLYLERDATLYTYERTKSESRYSLTQLLLHEMGHALHGRFLQPGFWGEAGDFDQPRGWLDEGGSEALGGSVFALDTGCFRLPVRTLSVPDLCSSTATGANLADLVRLRAGYDQSGVFAYFLGWSINFFLLHARPEVLRSVWTAVKAKTYEVEQFDLISPVPLATLQQEWVNAMASWCTSPTQYDQEPWRCPNDQPLSMQARTQLNATSCVLTGFAIADEKSGGSGGGVIVLPGAKESNGRIIDGQGKQLEYFEQATGMLSDNEKCNLSKTCSECILANAGSSCCWSGAQCMALEGASLATCKSTCEKEPCTMNVATGKPVLRAVQNGTRTSTNEQNVIDIEGASSFFYSYSSDPRLAIDLGSVLPVSELHVSSRYWAKHFDLYTSTEGKTWFLSHRFRQRVDYEGSASFSMNVRTRFLEFVFEPALATNGNPYTELAHVVVLLESNPDGTCISNDFLNPGRPEQLPAQPDQTQQSTTMPDGTNPISFPTSSPPSSSPPSSPSSPSPSSTVNEEESTPSSLLPFSLTEVPPEVLIAVAAGVVLCFFCLCLIVICLIQRNRRSSSSAAAASTTTRMTTRSHSQSDRGSRGFRSRRSQHSSRHSNSAQFSAMGVSTYGSEQMVRRYESIPPSQSQYVNLSLTRGTHQYSPARSSGSHYSPVPMQYS